MSVRRSEDPEVIDLGLVEQRPTAGQASVASEPVDLDAEPADLDTGSSQSVTEQLRRLAHPSHRPAAAVAAVVGLLVGAVAYGTYDRQQDDAAARSRPLLLAQVVSSTANDEGSFNVLVSVTNAGDDAVEVDGLAIEGAPDDFSRNDMDREVRAQGQSSFLVGGLLSCADPAPALDRVRIEVTTADRVPRSVLVPLVVPPNQRTEIDGQREYACSQTSGPPVIYVESTDVVSTVDGEVRVLLRLGLEGDRSGTLTDLQPSTSAFDVTVEGLPLELTAGLDTARLETTWRVADCARAGVATPQDAALVPVVDGEPTDRPVQLWDAGLAELVRLGARSCPAS